MCRDTDTDSIKMIIVKMVKIGIFGKNNSEFARDILVYKRLSGRWNNGVFRDSLRRLRYKGKYFTRIKITIFEFH